MVSLMNPDSTATASESVIDQHSHFNGLYRTARDMRIEGSAEGEIECEGTVRVAQNARLAAKVSARNVIIAGSAQGEIICRERFTMEPTGEMRGEVVAASLVIEEGAFFEGQFEMADAASQTDTPILTAPTSTFGGETETPSQAYERTMYSNDSAALFSSNQEESVEATSESTESAEGTDSSDTTDENGESDSSETTEAAMAEREPLRGGRRR